MTITAFPARNEYTATAGQTLFTYTFKIYASTDLNVYVTPSGQDANDATDIVTGYSVTGLGDKDGGTITLVAAVSVGDLVTIVSDIPESRKTNYQDNGDFLPDTVNADFDRVISLTKQEADRSGRTLAFQESLQNASELTLPNPEALKYVRWKADLTGQENVDPVDADTIVQADFVERVENISDLANLTIPTTTKTYEVLGRTDAGDGGGGTFYWDAADLSTEVTADTQSGIYVAPDSDATGASGAWVRVLSTNSVNISWYGATEGGTVDCSAAIQAALDAQTDATTLIGDVADTNLRFTSGMLDVLAPAGKWLIDTGLVLSPGLTLRLDAGAEIIAGTAGMTMVASTSDEDNIVDLGIFASKRTRIIGGTLDGNGLASRGIDYDTCAAGTGVWETLVIRCNYSKWNTTCNMTSGSDVLDTVASFTDVAEGDCLIIAEATGERRYIFMIQRFDSGAGTITLSNRVPETLAGTTIKHIAAGLTGRMLQQGEINSCQFIQNGVGIALGMNVTFGGDSFNSTDMDIIGGMCNKNIYCGILLDACSGSTVTTSVQRTENGCEIVSNNRSFSNKNTITYCESYNDAQFEAVAVGRSTLMFTVPMIANYADNTTWNLRWPQNTITTTFRRLFYNAGRSVRIDDCRLTSAVINENPNAVGDYAIIEQQIDDGDIWVNSVTGPTNKTLPTDFIVFSDGTYNASSAIASIGLFKNADLRTGDHRRYVNTGAARALSAYIVGEANPRLAVTPASVTWGPSTTAPDTTLGRLGLGLLRMQGDGGDWGTLQNVAAKTTAELNDITDTINTVGKFAGKQVWDSTLNVLLYAASAAAGGVWKKLSDDTTAAAPV